MPDAAVGIADRDRDGIADVQDNCPDVANPDQANEDADKFGDTCDVCPQIADNAAVDSDGDRVGDACDPNPGAHDTVWRYDGFHSGLPSWSRSLNWQAMGDKLQTTAAQNATIDSEYIFPPFTAAAAPDNFSVTMTVTVGQILGTTGDHSVGIEIYDKTADKGVDCGLDQAPAQGGTSSVLFLSDDSNPNVDKSVTFVWTTGTEYRITMTRHGSTYTCNLVGPGGPVTLSRNSTVVPRDGNSVDLWAYGMVAQYGSVQIIGTP